MVRIDGSYGEGGGQILRTSLAIATHLGEQLEIVNIRKNRKTPGLMPQHLTAVRACQQICSAEVEGDYLKSEKLMFKPGKIRPGKYQFDVAAEKRSAGSAALVLQTVALPLFFAPGGSFLRIKGGTHVPWSPPATYLKQIFFPTLSNMGLLAQIKVLDWGFYPDGGGEINLQIKGSPGQLRRIDFIERGKLIRVTGMSAVANLPISIAERQRRRAVEILNEKGIESSITIKEARSSGKGTLLFLTAEYEKCLAGFSHLGEKGIPAEVVAEKACQDFINFNGKNVAIEEHLADQLIPYLALARNKFNLNVSTITNHLLTNLWVVSRFLNIKIDIKGSLNLPGIITVEPK